MAGRREAAASVVECGGDGEWDGEPRRCGKGHRAAVVMETAEGGSICLVCFSNLVADPGAPSHHVSYALSQLSRAICGGGGSFLRELRAFHGHLLVLPLVQVLSSFDDEPLACQAIDLVSDLCSGGSECADSSVNPCESLARDFIARIADRLSSGTLAWSRRQVYTVRHSFLILDLSLSLSLSSLSLSLSPSSAGICSPF
ncbi:unnamed protein product [Spirodela intermedia]|uniref:Uncharacterized protein n=1 Tax=Spirodela intermedia TaxID=51605 RepID=A0A7I8JCM2_SPIIN|nr:unnamed protein product [Spirodela intermedia]CAA6667928.1 unnamed protein product [Spirodela intermedia]